MTIALATALQESGLRNIDHGDRDSLGPVPAAALAGLGHRSSRSWTRCTRPGSSTSTWPRCRGYSRLPLTVAAQRVQRSGYPQAYAKHEPDATLLAAALTGRAAATLTCEGRRSDGRAGRRGRRCGPRWSGTSARTCCAGAALRRRRDAVGLAAGGHGGLRRRHRSPAPEPTAPRAGHAQRGWELAHWAVAHAARCASSASRTRAGVVAEAGSGWRTERTRHGSGRRTAVAKSGSPGSSTGVTRTEPGACRSRGPGAPPSPVRSAPRRFPWAQRDVTVQRTLRTGSFARVHPQPIMRRITNSLPRLTATFARLER